MITRSIQGQLRFITFLSLVIVTAIVVLGLFSQRNLDKRYSETSAAITLAKSTLKLTILSQEYIRSPNEHQSAEWVELSDKLQMLIKEIDIHSEEGARTAQALRQNFRLLSSDFSQLRLYVQNRKSNFDDPAWHTGLATLQAKLISQVHTATNIASSYSEFVRMDSAKYRRYVNRVLLVVCAIGVSLILLLIGSIQRRISKSLDWLEKGIGALEIGAERPDMGRLKADEFHEIMVQFENMTAVVGKRYQNLIAELKVAKQVAERASQSKSDFLANISHEIRTPLSVIEGYAHLLSQRDCQNVDEYISKILWNLRFVTDLINDILDLSKVESGQVETIAKTVNLANLVAPTIETLADRAAQKSIRLECEGLEALPNRITTDPIKFRQIMLNIIGNAIKFTHKGGVFIKFLAENRILFMEVRDTGIGLKGEELESLFEPFVQADPSITRRYGGTGLGLALSRRLARAMGGDVQIKNTTLGEGSTFLVSIAMGEDSMINTNEQKLNYLDSFPIERHDTFDSRPLDNLRILLAEDNEDLQVLFRMRLNSAGAKVKIVSNGKEAVDAIQKSRNFDIVFMDIQMPVMDGYSAASAMRSNGVGIPIIACTAHLMKNEIERGRKAGMTDYLEKPANSRQIIDICNKYVH